MQIYECWTIILDFLVETFLDIFRFFERRVVNRLIPPRNEVQRSLPLHSTMVAKRLFKFKTCKVNTENNPIPLRVLWLNFLYHRVKICDFYHQISQRIKGGLFKFKNVCVSWRVVWQPCATHTPTVKHALVCQIKLNSPGQNGEVITRGFTFTKFSYSLVNITDPTIVSFKDVHYRN